MSGVYRKNTIEKNPVMEMVLRVTYKDGTEELFSFIDYQTVFEEKMLYIKVDEQQNARVPLTLVKHTDEKIISKVIF